MNYLAHFHLAWPEEGLVVGGLEGDFFKGPLHDALDQGVARGIRLHRSIDAYTDQHPETGALRRAFPARLRRVSGILIDISFDHFLCRYWSRFSELAPAEFNRRVYAMLGDRQQTLSAPSRRMLTRMREYDLLGRYAQWETVGASATRVGQRFRRGNPMQDVDDELALLRPALEAGFLRFYPDLVAFVRERRETQ